MTKITKINEHIVLLHELCHIGTLQCKCYQYRTATSIIYANTINMQLLAKHCYQYILKD